MPEPTITAESLIAELIDQGVIDEESLVTLLGADRHEVSINRLEMSLVANNHISDGRLALLKGAVSGRQVVANEDEIDISDALDARTAKTFGILLAERDPLTVLMVEDTAINIEAARRALGAQSFEVWLITAGQFASLWSQVYRDKMRRARQASVPDIFSIFDYAVNEGASDIHLKPGQAPWMRIDGKMRPMKVQPLDNQWLIDEFGKVVGESAMAEVHEPPFRVDTAFSFGLSRFRINLGLAEGGLTVVARKLPATIPSADELDLPPAIRKFIHLERGLVLVTGPTGSGKSTTLAALLAEVLRSPRTLMTLEDPIEFRFDSNTDGGLVYQRQLDKHFSSFAEALKAALRQDPDVILVGEMRDLETMRTAITAAETGHLVFGTLHTSSAEATVGRLINEFPDGEQNQIRAQLTSILKGVVSQSLLPKKSGRGRVAAFEVMVHNAAVAANLRKPEGMQYLRNTIATGSADGMQTMEMALVNLVMSNKVREEDARYSARDVKDFDSRLNEARGGTNLGLSGGR